jgi:hypothetical protein
MSRASARTPSVVFDAAVRATSPRLVLKRGLQAIKKGEGHGQIVAEDNRRLLGSATIDDDCRRGDATEARIPPGHQLRENAMRQRRSVSI